MITIDGQLLSSKNSKRIVHNNRKNGRLMLVKSKAALRNQESILWQLKDARKKFEWERMLIATASKYPYWVRFKIFRKTKQRFDLINGIQLLCDCLVTAGYIEDDDAAHFIPVFEPFEVDSKHPRVNIDIVPPPKETEP